MLRVPSVFTMLVPPGVMRLLLGAGARNNVFASNASPQQEGTRRSLRLMMRLAMYGEATTSQDVVLPPHMYNHGLKINQKQGQATLYLY